MPREPRSIYPGSFNWERQVAFALANDYGITRAPTPDELSQYAAVGLNVNEAARRYAAAVGSPRRPRQAAEPPPAPRKQPTLFD